MAQYQRTTGQGISWIGQKRELTLLKACPEASAHRLQMALQDLDRAFANSFAGRSGYPKPRRRGEHDSFRLPEAPRPRRGGPRHLRHQG